MDIISAIKKEITNQPKRVVIIMHTNPDADALGTSLGWAAFLKKHHHQVHVIAPTGYPAFLNWLPGIHEAIIAESNQQLSHELINQADLIFCIDFAILNRINELEDIVRQAKAKKIVIDHHLDKEDFADITLWDPKATAAAEMVYSLIIALGHTSYIDHEIATCLYVGILTDTVSFKTPNITPQAHRIVADLLEHKIDVTKISRLVYENNSLTRLKFLGFVLKNRLTVLPEYRTAYITIRAADAKQFKLATGDTEGIVNYALSIQGIVLAALIKEKQDMVSISLRSVGDIPVNTLAKKHFQGGGHKNAAGGISYLSLEETVSIVGIVLTIILLVIWGKHDFKVTKSGLQYRMEQKGSGAQPTNGDFLLLDIHYKTKNGTTVLDYTNEDIPLIVPYHDSTFYTNGGFYEALSLIKKKGDRFTVKIPAKQALGGSFKSISSKFDLKSDTPLYASVHLKDILNEDQLNQLTQEKQKIMMEKQQAHMKTQLPKDLALINSYLQEKKIQALFTDSGLAYLIEKPGKGAHPKAGDIVKIHYVGKTLKDQIFDTSIAQVAQKNDLYDARRAYTPFEFIIGAGNTIIGFEEGVKLLNKNAKAKIFIPSVLAYGAHAFPPHIESNANLIFELELVDIIPQK
eukprot:gene3012-3762_t